MANVLAEIKNDNHEAADWLLFYPFRRTQFYQDKIELMNGTKLPEVPVYTGPGNPTMQKALSLSGLLKTEAWLETIELVESILGEKKLVFLKYRREAAYSNRKIKGRPAWVTYVQHHYAEEMSKRYGHPAENFWIAEKTIKTWWAQMVELTARVAIKRKLL